jgi:hypothetical protein
MTTRSELFFIYMFAGDGNPLILIHDKKISNMNSLFLLLQISIKITVFRRYSVHFLSITLLQMIFIEDSIFFINHMFAFAMDSS